MQQRDFHEKLTHWWKQGPEVDITCPRLTLLSSLCGDIVALILSCFVQWSNNSLSLSCTTDNIGTAFVQLQSNKTFHRLFHKKCNKDKNKSHKALYCMHINNNINYLVSQVLALQMYSNVLWIHPSYETWGTPCTGHQLELDKQ